MKALAEALADGGEQFPFPYDLPAKIEPGFLVELLAAPRVGKSLIALDWALYCAKQGVPVLYHSSDTDYGTQAVRAVASLTNQTMDAVEADRGRWSSYLRDQELPIRWSQAGINDANFEELVMAESEYLGQPPGLIIVDVVMDLLRGEENVGNVRRIFRTLHNTGRKYGATVLALHHVKRGDAASGDFAVRMEDGLYSGEGIAEVVLTAWRSGRGIQLYLAKNRQGIDGVATHLPVEYAKARVG